jgi:DNA-binding NarL/FixJ family response regulator
MNSSRQSAEIIIADSQFLIAEGLKAILKDHYSISTVFSRDVLMKSLSRNTSSLLIMDHTAMDIDSFEEVGELRANFPKVAIIILSSTLTRNEVVELNNSGIRNILNKSVGKEELFDCIDAALKGKKYFSGQVLDLLMEPAEKKIMSGTPIQLTVSELEIIRLLTQGLTNKDIAQKKFLSVHTVMTHRKNIMRKLGASNASEMIMFAIRSGLIDNIEYHI